MHNFFSLIYINWFIIAILLVGLELIVPGVYIIWFGFAAAALGVITWIFPLNWMIQIALFASLSLIFTLIGIRLNRKADADIDSGELNLARGSEYINQIFVLDHDVIHGEGRLTIGDSSWNIAGDDAPKGTRIKIIKVSLNTLYYTIIDQ